MAKRGARGGGGSSASLAGAGTGGLSKLSVQELRAELTRRHRVVGGLVKRREKLMQRLRELDRQISDLGGTIGREMGVRKRPKNEMKLEEALARLLKGRTMSVTDAAQAVQTEGGYMTTSSSFRTIVNQTLINSGLFKRVGRGLYTLK